MKRTLPSLFVFAATQLTVACGPAMEVEEELAVESQAQALSASCTDSAVSLVQPDGAAVNFQSPNCGYAQSAATSTDGSYDQPLCTHKFVTEVRQINGQYFDAFVEAVPASTVTTESACESIAITGYAWGFANRVGWTSLGEVSTTGTWYPASCNELFCLPAYCSLYVNFASVSSGHSYSKVRVAGMAAAFGVFKGRVRTGLYSGPGPC